MAEKQLRKQRNRSCVRLQDRKQITVEVNVSQFPKNLKRIMAERGLTGYGLERLIGMNPSVVSTYLRGKAMPTAVSLAILSKALDVSMEDLMEGVVE